MDLSKPLFSPVRKARRGGMVFFSGQIGMKNGKFAGDDVASQTIQALNNIADLLEQEGMWWTDVLRIEVFLADLGRDYEAFNDAYREALEKLPQLPARTTIGVQALPFWAKVEIQVTAMKKELEGFSQEDV